MSLAVICPRDNVAAILSDDRKSVSIINRNCKDATEIGVAEFCQRHTEGALVEAQSPQDALELLSKSRRQVTALDFTLILLDGNLDIALVRTLVALDLEDLLQDASVARSVLDIVLAEPLPPSADVAGALSATVNTPESKALVQQIVSLQERVKLVSNAWLMSRRDPLIEIGTAHRVRGAFVRHGVFRRLVTEGDTQSKVESISGQLVFEVKGSCDPRVLRNFVSEYKLNLPKGTKRSIVDLVELDSNAIEARGKAKNESAPASAHETLYLRDHAQNRVDAIVERFRKGDDVQGGRFLDDLVADQSREKSNLNPLVRSISNVAKQVLGCGRPDLSMQVLQRAFDYQDGIDSVVYVQIGDIYRRLSKFDQAQQCYQKALTMLDTGGDEGDIRRKLIQVSVGKGDYEIALQAYRDSAYLADSAIAQCHIGALHRHLGNLNDARTAYRRGLAMTKKCTQAMIGLAEVKKQSGDRHGALCEYNQVIRKYRDELDWGSNRIFRLGGSFLYQLTRQFPSAIREYSSLVEDFPRDCDSHFQFGKLLLILGESGKAQEHLSFGMSQNTDDISRELFRIAFGDVYSASVASVDKSSPTQDRIVLPQFEGLFGCKLAYEALRNEDYEGACTAIQRVKFVDRLHKDFGFVLSVHAKRRLGIALDGAASQGVGRLKKRGYPILKSAVLEIEKSNFDDALEHERLMFQMVA